MMNRAPSAEAATLVAASDKMMICTPRKTQIAAAKQMPDQMEEK